MRVPLYISLPSHQAVCIWTINVNITWIDYSHTIASRHTHTYTYFSKPHFAFRYTQMYWLLLNISFLLMQRQQWPIRNSLQFSIVSVEEVASVCSENILLLGHSSYPQPGNGLTDIGQHQKQQPFNWCCCIRCVASFVAVVLVQTYYWCRAI